MIKEYNISLNQQEYHTLDKLVSMMGDLGLIIFTESRGQMVEQCAVTEMKDALRHLGVALSCFMSERMPLEDPFIPKDEEK